MNALEKLKSQAAARIAELRQEIETLEQFVKSADAAASLLSSGGAQVPKDAVHTGDTPPRRVRQYAPRTFQAPRAPGPRNPPSDSVVRTVIDILRGNGRPMTRRALHAALSSRGVEIVGADPVNTLGTILWRAKDRITTIDGLGYWPVGDPISQADPVLQFSPETFE